MALESVTHISDLNASNPVGATDPKSEGDDHLRNIKTALKTDFPNVNGACTPTPAEFNLLAGQEGGFLSKAISTGGGTADAITADFTPDISLTDGVTVIVRAQGANTITNPTFTPDGLAAKTIVKNSNTALIVGDIAGASHELILKYNSANDNWSLLNPAAGSHPGAVAGYDRGVTINLEDDVNNPGYVASTGLTKNTWESIGPTGSGATNIWSGLDVIPAGATQAVLSLLAWGQDSAATPTYISLKCRENGSATDVGLQRGVIAKTYAAAVSATTSGLMYVPLDGSNIFEAEWDSDTPDTTEVATIYLLGWIE